jgi:hypothetical protein
MNMKVRMFEQFQSDTWNLIVIILLKEVFEIHIAF